MKILTVTSHITRKLHLKVPALERKQEVIIYIERIRRKKDLVIHYLPVNLSSLFGKLYSSKINREHIPRFSL